MSKTPNTAKVSPGIKTFANQSKEEAANTHGGAKSQKSEEHYRSIVDKSVNTNGQQTYSAKRKRP